jgi:hypothetical protein
LVDSYLEFVAGRSRPNTLRAVAHDLKTFFTVMDKGPVDVVAADIFGFVADQRGDRTVVRISDGRSGLSARHDRPASLVDLGLLRVPGRWGRHVGHVEPGCRAASRFVVGVAAAGRCRWCGFRAHSPRSSARPR